MALGPACRSVLWLPSHAPQHLRDLSGLTIPAASRHCLDALGSLSPIDARARPSRGLPTARISCYEGNRSAILRVQEKTEQTEVFATLPGKIWSATMSKDGKTFVCEVGESASDVWLVEHFDPLNVVGTRD